jgi:hypothetical protein
MMARIALSTSCGPADRSLTAIVDSFAALDLAAVALHRHPVRERFRVPIVAIFGDGSGALAGVRLLVVDAAPSDAENRDRSLEELCRWLHGVRAPSVALRTPLDRTPAEIALIREALPKVGYWHDAARGGEEFLAAVDPVGASFDPLETSQLLLLRSALAARAPAVVALPTGCERERIVESLACARGVFGA